MYLWIALNKLILIIIVLSFTNRLSRTSLYLSLKTSFVYSNLFSLAKHQSDLTPGVKPMYRPKEWRQDERRKEKEEKRRSWYRKGNYSSVIFVPASLL